MSRIVDSLPGCVAMPDPHSDQPRAEAAETEAVPVRSGLRIVTSQELLEGKNELVIKHGEEMYRLRLTRSGKLILHK
ncbi:MAG: hemin uptake protein HemP [Pirellulales bacterium]|nr:hemin uptake protein HemP [Pirellulales bacterium]